jgi:hypothetical protein
MVLIVKGTPGAGGEIFGDDNWPFHSEDVEANGQDNVSAASLTVKEGNTKWGSQ